MNTSLSEDLTNIVWLYLLICAQIFDFKVCSSYIYIVFETTIGNYNNLITWRYVYTGHSCWLRNDRNGWSDVQTPPPSNFLLRHCAVKFFLGDPILNKVSEYIRFFLHSDGPLWHNLSFCDFRFKYLANYCIILDLENFLVKVWGGGGGG